MHFINAARITLNISIDLYIAPGNLLKGIYICNSKEGERQCQTPKCSCKLACRVCLHVVHDMEAALKE